MRKNLRKARLDAGLTMKETAEKVYLSPRQYQRIEYGTTPGAIDIWDALEELFQVHQRILRENE